MLSESIAIHKSEPSSAFYSRHVCNSFNYLIIAAKSYFEDAVCFLTCSTFAYLLSSICAHVKLVRPISTTSPAFNRTPTHAGKHTPFNRVPLGLEKSL